MLATQGWRLRGVGMGLAILLVSTLSGCGSDEKELAVDPDSPGPLAEFLGWEGQWRSGEEISEADRQKHYESQEFIADCMSQMGFEYYPEPYWADHQHGGADSDPGEEAAWRLLENDPEAFASEYGYGITTIDHHDVEHTPDVAEDPNLQYLESLTPAAQEEYQEALWGSFDAIAAEHAGEQSFDLDPELMGGCMAESWAQVLGVGGGESDPRFGDLWQEWEAITQRIDTDQRISEMVSAWTLCMAEAGYPGLDDLEDGRQSVHDRREELHGSGEDSSSDQPGVESGTSEPVEDHAEPGTSPELDEPDLTKLREFELAIARADFDCRREHGVDRIEREVRFGYEQAFVDEHRAELEAYRDWVNEQSGN